MQGRKNELIVQSVPKKWWIYMIVENDRKNLKR